MEIKDHVQTRKERQRELMGVVKKRGEVVLSDYKKLFPNFAERTLRKDL